MVPMRLLGTTTMPTLSGYVGIFGQINSVLFVGGQGWAFVQLKVRKRHRRSQHIGSCPARSLSTKAVFASAIVVK